jgi:nitrilase
MGLTRIGAVAGHFGRDLHRTLAKLAGIIGSAARDGLDLLVPAGATMGGYIPDLRHPRDRRPTAHPHPGRPELETLRRLARPLTLCVGFCQLADGLRYNAAVWPQRWRHPRQPPQGAPTGRRALRLRRR